MLHWSHIDCPESIHSGQGVIRANSANQTALLNECTGLHKVLECKKNDYNSMAAAC